MTGLDGKRLGSRVVQRREQLGMRTTKALAERVGMTPRALGDVENGRRTNYSPGTKARLEIALEWQQGSVDATLGGGEPTPLPVTTESLHQQAAILRAGIEMLREEQQSSEGLSTAKELELDVMIGRLASTQAELADAEYRHHQAVEDERAAQLVALWLLAHRVSNPESLAPARFTDAAVALARQVALFAESEVGGFSRMQELRREYARVDEHKEDGDAVEGGAAAGASSEAQQGQEVLAATEGDDPAAAVNRDLPDRVKDLSGLGGVPGVDGGGGQGDMEGGHDAVC
ncbi:helix-turn-helix transcriptional regulator [Mycobacterium sp. 23]|uniref:helix-turn-helix transcriptional regulator n=1 Tax=Mycobacterium sp. 23 TaxID=3400424 RepID=UPI003AAAC0CB